MLLFWHWGCQTMLVPLNMRGDHTDNPGVSVVAPVHDGLLVSATGHHKTMYLQHGFGDMQHTRLWFLSSV